MSDEQGDANQHMGRLYELLVMVAIISVPVLWENGVTTFEDAVVTLLMIVALLLVIE